MISSETHSMSIFAWTISLSKIPCNSAIFFRNSSTFMYETALPCLAVELNSLQSVEEFFPFLSKLLRFKVEKEDEKIFSLSIPLKKYPLVNDEWVKLLRNNPFMAHFSLKWMREIFSRSVISTSAALKINFWKNNVQKID